MGKRRPGSTEKAWGAENLRAGLAAFLDIAGEAKIGVYASSGAFYLFLALFPTAALLCSLLPLLPFTQEALLDYLLAHAPDPDGAPEAERRKTYDGWLSQLKHWQE